MGLGYVLICEGGGVCVGRGKEDSLTLDPQSGLDPGSWILVRLVVCPGSWILDPGWVVWGLIA